MPLIPKKKLLILYFGDRLTLEQVKKFLDIVKRRLDAVAR